MAKRWDILGFGCVAVDDLLYVKKHPSPDSKMRIQDKRREGGGLTGTALVAAARLGAKTSYCGVVGDDELSRFTVEELEREGVDCSEVLVRPGASVIHAVVIVAQSTGQRSILYSKDGVQELQPHEMTPELIAGCRVLFVDHEAVESGLHAAIIANRLGIPIVGDFEVNRHPQTLELIRRVDHLIITIGLACRLTDEREPVDMVRALSRADRSCTAITAGDRGCWYAEHQGGVRHFPAFRVEVIDTTGCGDVFHGAYAACVARGESVDDAIRLATATAGIKATQPGGRSGIPDRAMVERFLEEYAHENH